MSKKLALPVGNGDTGKAKSVKKAGGPVNMKTTSAGSGDEIKVSDKYAEQERRYKAEEALLDIERAEKHKGDKDLMRDVKKHAREKIKNLNKIC